MGVRFTASKAGKITGIRYYRSADDTGTRTVSLWAADGTQLATAEATDETASGWQYVAFAEPVEISSGAEYRASYYTTGANYAVDINGLASPVTNGPLTATGSVYAYSKNFPDNTAPHNYWVDVGFVPDS